MSQAYLFETHPVATLSGDAIVSRIELLGWGALISSRPATQTWTENGRVWWRFTQSTALFELFRDPGFDGDDRLAFGTVGATTAGRVTLEADNTSGITSPTDAIHVTNGDQGVPPTQDSNGDMIVNYCDEDDINQIYRDVANELDGSDQWLGIGTRFESLIGAVMVDEFNPMLRQLLSTRLGWDASNVAILCAISDPRQLAPILARYCAARLYERRGAVDEDGLKNATKVRGVAERMLGGITISIDYTRDGLVDNKQRGGVVRLIRG